MSDRIMEWLDESQRLADQATDGTWVAEKDWLPDPGDSRRTLYAVAAWSKELVNGIAYVNKPDAEFIAEARTRLPQAVAALRAVMGLHQQAAYQRNVPRRFRRTHEDHLPYRSCDGCGEEWPCPTITAIADAFKEWVPLARAALTAAVGDDDE